MYKKRWQERPCGLSMPIMLKVYFTQCILIRITKINIVDNYSRLLTFQPK